MIKKITEVLHGMGIPANLLGYYYLRTTLLKTTQDDKLVHAITTELYPFVAKEHNTTPQRVERAIRHAIACAWHKGDKEFWERIFGYKIQREPTNGTLIAAISDSLRLSNQKNINEVSLTEDKPYTFQYCLYCEDNRYGVIGNNVITSPLIDNKEIAEYFVSLINEIGDVHPVHITDVLEDFLVNNYL